MALIDDASSPATRPFNRLGHPAIWAGAFAFAMVVIDQLERHYHVGRIGSVALILLASLLLIPIIKSAQRCQEAKGISSPAITRYNTRGMIWAFGYVAALTLALFVKSSLNPTGPLLWLIAVLPALPILFLIWAMGRYLQEETDEYLRHRQVQSGLIATGILLTAATFWGFLETFGVAPHAEAWWAVPVWAIGLGVGNALQGRAGR